MSLNYFEHLNRVVNNKSEFGWLRDFLRNGWHEFLNYFHTDDILMLLPGEELAANRVEIVPTVYQPGVSFGDILLRTLWYRGYAPRAMFTNDSKGTSNLIPTIKFLPKIKQLPSLLMQLPLIQSLDECLYVDHSRTRDTGTGRGIVLNELIKIINSELETITIKVHPKLASHFISLKIENTRSLTQELDAICYCIDAKWDWVGIETGITGVKSIIYLVPNGNCGTVYSYRGDFYTENTQ